VEAHHSDQGGDSPSVPTLYTVGHGNRSAEEFLDVLRAAAVGCIVDVRAYPVSRRHPQFSQTTLADFLGKAGVDYRWLGKALGGFRQASSASVHTALAAGSLRAYADHMGSAVFLEGIAELLHRARLTPSAVLCAERLPEQCHRAMISDYLTASGVRVIHILDRDSRVSHRLDGRARWAQGRLLYDQRSRDQLEWEF
jgi:uncharacterized protein (DUF488 family)